MHVFAVQGKEDELCEAFDVVAKSLSRAEVMSLCPVFRKPRLF